MIDVRSKTISIISLSPSFAYSLHEIIMLSFP